MLYELSDEQVEVLHDLTEFDYPRPDIVKALEHPITLTPSKACPVCGQS